MVSNVEIPIAVGATVERGTDKARAKWPWRGQVVAIEAGSALIRWAIAEGMNWPEWHALSRLRVVKAAKPDVDIVGTRATTTRT